MIGYMRIVSKEFCEEWKNRCLNVHPSLLPDFAKEMDLEVHSSVIKSGKTITGCTIHFVTEDVDGGPILYQERCDVKQDDTPESLKKRVQNLEGNAFIWAIKNYSNY
jgi:folate-dependent phosphoribosylglycinamide formyltransferase PurN